MPNQVKGILLAVSGVLVISPDSLLIRLVNLDLWSLMFLRGLFIALVLLLLTLLLDRRGFRMLLRDMDRAAWLMATLIALSSFFFVAAIQTTSVAHTLIIVGSVPVFAALLGMVLLREAVSPNTGITILVVFVGLLFVVHDQQQSTLIGDLLAFVACLMWALNFLLARRTRTDNRMFVMMLSGIMMLAISLPLTRFGAMDLQQVSIGGLLGVLNGLALSLLIYAPRFIPAAEVAVFLPVETVLGSLLVWWFLGEFPGVVSLIAGSIIILALMVNSLYQLHRSGRFG